MEILAVIFAALSAVLSIVLILMVSKQKIQVQMKNAFRKFRRRFPLYPKDSELLRSL